MSLLEFLKYWANPINWVKVCKEEEYYKALELIQSGDFDWNNVKFKLDSEVSFNPRAVEAFSFLPKNILNAKLFKFISNPDGLVIFINSK